MINVYVYTNIIVYIMIIKKARDHRKSKRVQKNIYFYFIDYTKVFDCESQYIVGNS